MGLQAKIFFCFGILAFFAVSHSNAIDATFKGSLEQFSNNLFGELLKSSNNKNIVFSPFSTQTCLAMVRMGADGETAVEMDHSLGFTGQTDESIADNYYTLLAHYEDSGNVHVANKVYVMKGYELQDDYSDVLAKKFMSSLESVDFAQAETAASTMNNWVETKTNNLIKDIVQPAELNGDTRMVLLNAIHFEGEWVNLFSNRHTEEADFFVNETSSVKVQMMKRNARFEVGTYPELQANAIRLPYKDSDLSMLILLPESRTGLAEMQEKLMDVKLDSLASEMGHKSIELHLPKFSVEYKIEMTQPLKKLGMSRMFNNADFGKMFKSSGPISVSKIIHKAFIRVNERGTEAAAVTRPQISSRMMSQPFVVDHPFYYAIVNNDNVILFQGNVVEF